VKRLLLFLMAASAFGGWLDLGSSTRLVSQCPVNDFGGIDYDFGGTSPSGHCAQSLMRAWCGAGLDAMRNRLIFWCGGHNDYSGNEVYAISFTSPVGVARLTDPSDFTQNPGGCPDTNTVDGTPVSRHTYAGLIVEPDLDVMLAIGGAPAPCGGPLSTGTYSFNLATPGWTTKDPVTGYTIGPSSIPPICARNPANHLIYCVDTNTLTVLNASTNTRARLGTEGSIATYNATNGVIDPTTGRMWFFGNQSGTGVLRVLYIDIAGAAYSAVDVTAMTTGCSPLAVDYPGLTWDSRRHRIVGYPNNGASVYAFNPSTLACGTLTFPDGPPTVTTSGTFSRFQYVESLDLFVLALDTIENVFTLTLPPSGPAVSGPVTFSGKVSQ